MEQVTRREGQAWEEDDKDGALYCLKMENGMVCELLHQNYMEELVLR